MDSANKVMAQLLFGIDSIKAQMETIEKWANETALTAQQAFSKANLTAPGMDTKPLTAQQAMIAQITAQGEAKKAAIVAEGEAKISAIMAKEALTRQAIAQKEAQTEMAIMRKQMAEEKLLYMQARRAAFEEKPTGFAGLMERRLSWLYAGGLVMGGLAGVAETVSTIKEVEYGMTTIARVIEDTTFSFKGMRDELQALGVQYGNTWDQVSDIATRWAQAGYDMNETLELTKSSLLALNTAELNAEEATNGMIAIMSQWGLTAEELLPTIDKINKVADDYAITSQDLVMGLTRSSGAAKVLGLTMNETIAILTTMREATGRTGKEVGNALNSILSFMQRPTALKAFETQGIAVFADEARTQFRNVIEIFDEMSAKWPKMGEATRDIFVEQAEAAGLYTEEMSEMVGLQEQYNDLQQRDLSQAAAGIYRRNYLLALLQNWSTVNKVLISQEESLGYSLKENERTMQTLEKQYIQLKASAEQLAVALGDAGLLNEFKGLVDGVTDVVQWFNNLDGSTQTLLLTVLEVTVAVKLLSAAFKAIGVSGAIAGMGGLMAGWAVPIAATTAATRTLMTAITGLTTLLTNLGKAGIAALGGPVPAAIIAVGTAVGFVIREVRRANEALIENGNIAEGMISEYDELTAKLSGLTKGTDEYNKTVEELRVKNTQIAEAIPSLIDGWDKETDSIKINREEMERMVQSAKDAKASLEEVPDALAKKAQEEIDAQQSFIQEIESEKNVVRDLIDRREKLVKALARQAEGSKEAQLTQEALGETEQLIAEIAKKAEVDRNATIDEIINGLDKLKMAQLDLLEDTQTTERDKAQAVKEGALARLEIIGKELAAYDNPKEWGFFQAAGNFLKTANPLNKYNYDPTKPETARFLSQENLIKEQAKAVLEAEAQSKKIDEWNAKIKQTQDEITRVKSDIATGGGPPPPAGGGTGGGGKDDWLSRFLDNTFAAVIAQERLNNAMQRGLDGMEAKRSVMMDSARTMAEYVDGMRLQASFEAQYEEQQKSLHTEANLYRAAIEVLEAKQRTLNTSTDEGREAYAKIADEIEKAKQKVDELGTSWWQVEGMQRAISSDRFRIIDEWIRKLADGGAITLEQEYDLYERLGKSNLLYADRARLQEKLVDLGKKLIEQEIDKQIKALEAEKEAFKAASDARIKAIQQRIDLLDEENDRLKEQTRIMEAQRSITDAQQALADAQAKLENVKGEKDTRIWKDGRWEYIANPEKVRQAEKEVKSAQDKLVDARNSFNELMLELDRERYRRELEEQIEAEKEKQAEQLKAYDERKKDLEKANEDIIKIMTEGGQNADAELQNILTTINITMSDKLMEILQMVRIYASQMRSEFASIARAASEAGIDMGGILPGFDKGGPIPFDMAIQAHRGEYVLNKRDVDQLGGFAGVEKLRTAIRLPSFKMIGAGNVVRTSNTSSVKNDNRVVIENANFPHVVDGSGLIRNLKQLASA